MTTVLQFPVARAAGADPAPRPQPPERATAPESARILKQALQRAFPATKFSVRLGRGTGYGDCDVSWTDGPTTKAVEPITLPFEGQTFDGMTDMREYTRATLPDGRQSGLKLILTQRHVSVTLARKAAAQVARFYGLEVPKITETPGGYWQVENDSRFVRDDVREYWGTLIHRAASDRTMYAGD